MPGVCIIGHRDQTKANSNGPDVQAALASLKRRGTKTQRDGFARYGIHTDKAFGVSMVDIQSLATPPPRAGWGRTRSEI